MDALLVFLIGIYFIYRKKKEIPSEALRLPIGKNEQYYEDEDAFMVYYHLLIKK